MNKFKHILFMLLTRILNVLCHWLFWTSWAKSIAPVLVCCIIMIFWLNFSTLVEKMWFMNKNMLLTNKFYMQNSYYFKWFYLNKQVQTLSTGINTNSKLQVHPCLAISKYPLHQQFNQSHPFFNCSSINSSPLDLSLIALSV